MKATLSNYRQAPRKIRLIANSLRGKKVTQAQTELRFMVKRGALPIEKLLASAVANAMQTSGINKESLFIKEIRVDKGTVLKRSMPRAFGRASAINKRSSHVTILLAEKGAEGKAVVVKAEKKSEAKKDTPVKKTATKKTTTKKSTVSKAKKQAE